MENVFRVLSIVGISFIFFSCIHSPESIRMPKTDEEINKRIEEIRTKTVTLSLKSKNGKVLAKNWITIEQTKHAFLFGCSFADYWNDISPVFEKNFTAIFNFATLPIYWAAYNEKRVERMTEWCMKRGITVKAHPLVWHEVCPQLTIKTNEEAEKIIKQRVMSVVSHFKGSVDMFDIINESLVSFRFNNIVGKWVSWQGPVKAAEKIFDWAKEANPDGLFLINDYDTSKNYLKQINQLIKDGYIPAAIGIQSHMLTGIWTDNKIWDTCERFKNTGIPIHFTELTVVSANTRIINDYSKPQSKWNTTNEGEKKQAKEVKRIYRLLFSHPAVEAITWWSYTDQGAWLAAPSGLFRKDMTPKPAYKELVKLIKKEWWTGPLALETNENGQVAFRGYMGDYRVLVDGKERYFRLDKNTSDMVEVVF